MELFFFIVVIIYAFSAIIFKGQMVKVFGFDFAIVKTSSMFPTIKRYDFVIITKNTQNVAVNDIVVFFDDSHKNLIVHRVVEIVEENDHNFFITKGDNNQFRDAGSRTENEIYAKCSFKIPYLGLIITFLKSPIGLCVLLLNFITVACIIMLWSFENKILIKKL